MQQGLEFSFSDVTAYGWRSIHRIINLENTGQIAYYLQKNIKNRRVDGKKVGDRGGTIVISAVNLGPLAGSGVEHHLTFRATRCHTLPERNDRFWLS